MHVFDMYYLYTFVQISRVEIVINYSLKNVRISQGMFLSCKLPVA